MLDGFGYIDPNTGGFVEMNDVRNDLLPVSYTHLDVYKRQTCDCGGWIPMKKSTGTFSVYDRKDNCDCCNMIICLLYTSRCV